MMPIVDPHVGLSRDSFTLEDYLTRSESVHVLRMVAVQRPKQVDATLADLQYYRDSSTTRGLGGFPNGVVAYCDLAEMGSLDRLLNHSLATTFRGVHFEPTENLQVNGFSHTATQVESIPWIRQLELLSSKEMSLDLTLSIDQCELVDTVVRCNPAITIMVTMRNWAQWLDTSKASLLAAIFERLATYENVNIKLCDDACSTDSSYANVQEYMINKCATYFGYDRMMFASVQGSANKSMTISEQWASYVNVANAFTASQRDKLFRANAIRLYRL